MFEIKKISASHEDYPSSLKIIKDYPKDLYYIGNIKSIGPSLAVIGTRKCSSYEKQVTSEFCKVIANRNITIISGFAPGIDTVAHTSAIEMGRRTIAVLGTGLAEKSIFPKENIPLIEKIVNCGGGLISEYAPNVWGTRFTFPQRNRIVAALTDATLVVEAPQKSGAMITANYAFLYGKPVLAVPGSIFFENAKGTNNLIKRGAKLVDKVEDILQYFPLCDTNHSQISLNKWTNAEESNEEFVVLNLLKNEPMHVDKIIEITKLSPAKVAEIITTLEIEEKIKNIGENIYSCFSISQIDS